MLKNLLLLAISIALIVVWFFFFKNKNISSPKNNEVFVQTSKIDNASIDITNLWGQIWQQSFQSNYSMWKATRLLNSMSDQINVDIFSLLDNSSNKSDTLNWYLSLSNANIQESENVIQDLKAQSQAISKLANECQTQKTQYDKEFFEGLKNNEPDSISRWMEWSKQAWSCTSENKIQANAYNAILNKLNWANKLLKQKYELLNKNKILIVENYELFKSNSLEQLLQVKNSFKTLNTTSPTSANSDINWIKFPNIF